MYKTCLQSCKKPIYLHYLEIWRSVMSDKLQEVRDFLETTAKSKGMSLNSLSLQLGKNPTYLFHFVKRHSPRRLDEQSRRKLARILDVPEQKLCDYAVSTDENSGFLSDGIIQDKLSTITDLLGFGAKGQNSGIDIIDMDGRNKGAFNKIKHNKIGVEYLSLEAMKTYGIDNNKDIKIVKNTSDAMAPTITTNDLVWVDTSYDKPTSDGIYMINTDNNVLLRRLQINPFDGSLEVSADNSAYKTFNLKSSDNIDIIGKVLWVSHRL